MKNYQHPKEPSWSPANIDKLQTLHAAGLSASKIAMHLGGNITRNAVIGKLHRLGLSRIAPPVVEREAPERKSRRIERVTPSLPPSKATPSMPGIAKARHGRPAKSITAVLSRPIPVEPKRSRHRIGIAELEPSWMCKWPIGDPRADDFGFCGHRREGDHRYCDYHARIAFIPDGRAKV